MSSNDSVIYRRSAKESTGRSEKSHSCAKEKQVGNNFLWVFAQGLELSHTAVQPNPVEDRCCILSRVGQDAHSGLQRSMCFRRDLSSGLHCHVKNNAAVHTYKSEVILGACLVIRLQVDESTPSRCSLFSSGVTQERSLHWTFVFSVTICLNIFSRI